MKQEKEKVLYAGTVYEVLFRGDRVLRLRSLKDRKLIVHVNVNSALLKPYDPEEVSR